MAVVLPTDAVLRSIVDLRQAIRSVRDDSIRARLREVEVGLRGALGPSVKKTAAARALGVSVTALDNWIERGVLPAVARRGTSRLEVETAPLLDLLSTVIELRERGLRRPVAAAVRQLGWRDDPGGRRVLGEDLAKLPRPNPTFRELRADFERSSPRQRVLEATALSKFATGLAARR